MPNASNPIATIHEPRSDRDGHYITHVPTEEEWSNAVKVLADTHTHMGMPPNQTTPLYRFPFLLWMIDA